MLHGGRRMQTGSDDNGPRRIRRNDHRHHRPGNPEQLLGDDPRPSGHRNLSAGFGNDLTALRQRRSESRQGTDPFHHRPGSLQSRLADRRGQRRGRQSRRSHRTAHLRQQEGAFRPQRRFAVRPLDGQQQPADSQGPARTGRGTARERRQQPLLHGREGSDRRRGGNAAVPRRRAGERFDPAAADHRIGQLGDVRLLLDDRKPAPGPDTPVRLDRRNAQEHAGRTVAAQRRFDLRPDGPRGVDQRRHRHLDGQRVAARGVPQPERAAAQRRRGQRHPAEHLQGLYRRSAGRDVRTPGQSICI